MTFKIQFLSIFQLYIIIIIIILGCEVKLALGSITTNKASGGEGIPADPLLILKDDAVKELPSICQEIWESQQ